MADFDNRPKRCTWRDPRRKEWRNRRARFRERDWPSSKLRVAAWFGKAGANHCDAHTAAYAKVRVGYHQRSVAGNGGAGFGPVRVVAVLFETDASALSETPDFESIFAHHDDLGSMWKTQRRVACRAEGSYGGDHAERRLPGAADMIVSASVGVGKWAFPKS